MRTFEVKPTSPGQHVHHLWQVIAVAEDGTEVLLETYGSLQEAERAKAGLERSEMDNRR